MQFGVFHFCNSAIHSRRFNQEIPSCNGRNLLKCIIISCENGADALIFVARARAERERPAWKRMCLSFAGAVARLSTQPTLPIGCCLLCPNMFEMEEWLAGSTILFTKCRALRAKHPGHCILYLLLLVWWLNLIRSSKRMRETAPPPNCNSFGK